MAPGFAQGPAVPTPRPGLWQVERTFVELRLAGVPEAMSRRQLGRPRRLETCVTPATAHSFFEPTVGNGCRIVRKPMGRGGVSMTSMCPDGRAELGATLAPERIVGIVTRNGTDRSFMKARIDARRIGVCPSGRGRAGP